MGRTGGSGTIVLENCLVNNVTNLSILIGLPAIFWAMHIIPKQPKKRRLRDRDKTSHLNRLSLLLTTTALLFFTGVLWALARDGRLDFGDGLALVGIFLFWQVFHVYEVLKTNVQKERHLSLFMLVDLLLIIAGGYGVYISIEQLVDWIPKTGPGILVFANLGWLSGLLMVLPNALLAFYYAKTGKPEIVYSSQIGDGHICIPICVGIFALYTPIKIPSYFDLSVFLILSAGLVHFLFLSIFGRLPRIMGVLLTLAYFFFIYKGLISP
jgi:cation:H+ antiporter